MGVNRAVTAYKPLDNSDEAHEAAAYSPEPCGTVVPIAAVEPYAE